MIEKETLGKISLINGDCMEVLKSLPDNAFDLAICDPPYGLSYSKHSARNNYISNDWDKNTPSREYFTELFRVSKNQIIWGGNYFDLPPTKCFVFWHKHQPVKNFADGELAWTSFNKVARCFDFSYFGNINSEPQRIHPTQKPVKLYGWLLNNFANTGDKILDTHLGSGSICLAAHDLGFEMLGIELDKEYYKAAKQRLIYHQAQLGLF